MADPALSLTTIPFHLHVEILSFVPVRHLLVYSRCSKYLKQVAEDDRLWVTKEAIAICTTSPPPARICVSATMYKDYLLIYGGDTGRDENIDKVKNDVWTFSFKDGGKWQEHPPRGALRPVLTEHSGVLYKDNVYLFGGNSGGGSTNYSLGDVLHRVELDTKVVKPVETEQVKIPARSAHSAVVYKDKMYIYGGWNTRESFSDLLELDLKTLKWRTVQTTGESPGKRRAHTAIVHENYMYLFGGYNATIPATPSADFYQMHRFNFEKKEWETFYGTGEVPRGRSRTDMVVYEDKIYVLGGFDRDKREYLSDLCEFNIQTHAWKIYKTNLKQHVKGVCQHKCVLYKHWLVVVFGYSAKECASTNKMFAINLRKKGNTK